MQTCDWVLDDEDDDRSYASSCGEMFIHYCADKPINEWFKYCPFCGKELLYKIATPENEEGVA